MRMDDLRRTGRSTAQMKAARNGALYVCPTMASIAYFRELAISLDRRDLEFTSLTWAVMALGGWSQRLREQGIVFDHACLWAGMGVSQRDRELIREIMRDNIEESLRRLGA